MQEERYDEISYNWNKINNDGKNRNYLGSDLKNYLAGICDNCIQTA